MAELALGVMGVIPLLGAAYKSYRSVYSTLKAYKHSSRDLSNISKRFRLAKSYFQHECCLLLRFALDEESIKAMRADLDHENWSTPDLEAQLQESLASGYASCELLADGINESLKKFGDELQLFEDLANDHPEGERVNDTIRRFRKRAQVAFNKSKYEGICKGLRESNFDLTALREQISELQYPTTSSKPIHKNKSQGDWGAMCRMRCVSLAFHQGLQSAWSCGDESHTNHSVKLFLNFGKARQTSDLSISIASRASWYDPDEVTRLSSLQVCSEKLAWINTSLPTPSPSPPNSMVEAMPPQKRTKTSRVRVLASSAPEIAENSLVSRDEQPETRQGYNLNDFSNLCGHLSQGHSRLGSGEEFMGYLDGSSTESFRHDFYGPMGTIDGSEEPLNGILNSSYLNFMTVQDRLKLARTVAIAALTYHATPWMKEYWRLGDLRFLNTAKDSSNFLQSLHLGAELNFEDKADRTSAWMDIAPSLEASALAQSSEDERLFVGIKNLTLHNLGVALLGIDKWQEFDPADLTGVRKAARNSMFGPKYQDVVQKCLGCEFRHGHDLSQSKFHRTVYESVVGSLEDMIASLDVND